MKFRSKASTVVCSILLERHLHHVISTQRLEKAVCTKMFQTDLRFATKCCNMLKMATFLISILCLLSFDMRKTSFHSIYYTKLLREVPVRALAPGNRRTYVHSNYLSMLALEVQVLVLMIRSFQTCRSSSMKLMLSLEVQVLVSMKSIF